MSQIVKALARFDNLYDDSFGVNKAGAASRPRKSPKESSGTRVKGPQAHRKTVKPKSTFRYGGSALDTTSNSKLRLAAEKRCAKRDSGLLNAFQMLNSAIEEAPSSATEDLQASPGLRKALGELLRNEDIDNIAARMPLYSIMLRLLKNVFSNPATAGFMLQNLNDDTQLGEEEVAVADLLLELKDVSLTVARVSKHGDSDFRIIDANEPAAIKIAFEVVDTYEAMVKSTVSKLKRRKVAAAARSASSTSSSSSLSSSSSSPSTRASSSREAAYEEALREERFKTIDLCDLVSANKQSHAFYTPGSHAGNVSSLGRGRLQRIAKEMAALSKSLPIYYASSIFLRPDNDRMDIMKCAIIGPEQTPYANGLFEFDIYFPSEYPQIPPKVLMRTTDSGTVRFNPNLYANGKVLVSMQSLIFVSNPYFNEPGYESRMNTPGGEKASNDYNQHVRLQTLKVAINNQIRWRSRSAFESVILKHFTLKAPEIAAQVAEWCDHASASKKEAMKAVAADLTQLLAALPKVQGSLKRSVEMVVLDSSRDTAPPKRAKAAQSVIDLT